MIEVINIVNGCQPQDLQDFMISARSLCKLPDNGCVNLVLPVLENSLLCRLLLIIRLLQLDLEGREGHDIDSWLLSLNGNTWLILILNSALVNSLL